MVRFQGTVVELPRVVVMTNTAYPLMLGIEWIAAVNAAVSAKDGRGVMTLPDPNVGTETKPVVQDPKKIDEEKHIDETQSEPQTKSVVSENSESKEIKEEECAREEQNVLPPPLQEKSEKEAAAGVEPGPVAEEEKQEKMNETKVTPSPSKRRIRRNLYPRSLSYIKFMLNLDPDVIGEEKRMIKESEYIPDEYVARRVMNTRVPIKKEYAS